LPGIASGAPGGGVLDVEPQVVRRAVHRLAGAGPALDGAQPGAEAPGDPTLAPRPDREGAAARLLRRVVVVGAIGLLIGALAIVGSHTLVGSPVSGRDAGPPDTPIGTPDAAVPEVLVRDAAIPDAVAAPESKRYEEEIFRAIAEPVWPNIDCF